MKRWISVALATALGVFALAGTVFADKRTISDEEGDAVPPHEDFVSGTYRHFGKRGLVHTVTVAGKVDEREYPLLYMRRGGRRQGQAHYIAQVTEGGAFVTNLKTGANKPLQVSINDPEELVNTYRFIFRRGAIGNPKRKYGFRWAWSDANDVMPNDGYAIHNLRK